MIETDGLLGRTINISIKKQIIYKEKNL